MDDRPRAPRVAHGRCVPDRSHPVPRSRHVARSHRGRAGTGDLCIAGCRRHRHRRARYRGRQHDPPEQSAESPVQRRPVCVRGRRRQPRVRRGKAWFGTPSPKRVGHLGGHRSDRSAQRAHACDRHFVRGGRAAARCHADAGSVVLPRLRRQCRLRLALRGVVSIQPAGRRALRSPAAGPPLVPPKLRRRAGRQSAPGRHASCDARAGRSDQSKGRDPELRGRGSQLLRSRHGAARRARR